MKIDVESCVRFTAHFAFACAAVFLATSRFGELDGWWAEFDLILAMLNMNLAFSGYWKDKT